MTRYPTDVDYRWTTRDVDITRETDPFATRVSPYEIPPGVLKGAAAKTAGDLVSLPLNRSWNKWYLNDLTPADCEWVEIPPDAAGAKTIQELCAKLLAIPGGIFPAKYYDIRKQSQLRPGQKPIARMLFEHWSNTDFRYAHTCRAGFAWDAVTEQLELTVGTTSIQRVLGKKPKVEKIGVVPRKEDEPAQIKREMAELVPRKLIVGYNYMWAFNKYGTFFGPHKESWIDLWINFFRLNLEELAALGVKYVRIFLLGSGENMGAINPEPTDGELDATVTLPTASEMKPFVDDLQMMLESIKLSNTGIRLIPSFVDFGMFGTQHGNSGRRRSLILDKAKRTAFLDQVLDPLLDAAIPYKEHIYLWEVINEPYWACHWVSAPLWGTNRPKTPPVSVQEMGNFLADAWGRIGKKGFNSTVGHRFFDDLAETWTGDMRQFHYYSKDYGPFGDPAKIPTYIESKGAFIGEIDAGLASGPGWPELNGKDLDPNKCLFVRLELLEQKGYELALVWPDTHWQSPDELEHASISDMELFLKRLEDPLKLSEEAKKSIKEFTKGTPRKKDNVK